MEPGSRFEMGGEGNREKEKRQVVRGFIVQSKSVERINGELDQIKDFRDLFLTKTLLAEKNAKSEQSAGQLTPIGGKVDKGEKLDSAMVREMLQETHLRPVSFEKIGPNFSYTIKSSKSGKPDVDNEQQLYIIEILPSDRAYPLDPEEDKLEVFHGLDLKELGELFGQGEIQINEKTLSLLGNLRLPGYGVDDPSIIISDEKKDIPVQIFSELWEKLCEREVTKRRSVLEYLFRSFHVSDFDKSIWNQRFDQASSFFQHQNIWNEFLGEYSQREDFERHFLAAVDLSNFEEETRDDLPNESQIEAMIRFTYTLLNTRYDSNTYFEIAKRSEKLGGFVGKIEKFIQAVSSSEQKDETSLSRSLAQKIEGIEQINDELLAWEFCNVFGIDQDSAPFQLEYINEFIHSIVEKGINIDIQSTDKKDEGTKKVEKSMSQKDLVTQITGVANAQLGKLIKYAFALSEPSWNIPEDNIPLLMKKRIVFEARRKLVLFLVMSHVSKWRDENIRNGNQPIEDLTTDMWTLPLVSAWRRSVLDQDGVLQNIIIDTEKDPDMEYNQETQFRKFKPKEKETSFLVGTEVRTKEDSSLRRKAIVRGSSNPQELRDIYGRAITIVADPNDPNSNEYICRREERTVFVDGQYKVVSDMAPVLDILERYAAKPGVKILEYKPTPQQGQKIQSNGVGGGGDIRLAKFYIEHTDENGIIRYEEVQIFSPGEDGQTSSLYWLERKKEDDKRYFLDRMLTTKGLRSFVELLFPTIIFGEPIHTVVHKKNKKTKASVDSPKK